MKGPSHSTSPPPLSQPPSNLRSKSLTKPPTKLVSVNLLTPSFYLYTLKIKLTDKYKVLLLTNSPRVIYDIQNTLQTYSPARERTIDYVTTIFPLNPLPLSLRTPIGSGQIRTLQLKNTVH